MPLAALRAATAARLAPQDMVLDARNDALLVLCISLTFMTLAWLADASPLLVFAAAVSYRAAKMIATAVTLSLARHCHFPGREAAGSRCGRAAFRLATGRLDRGGTPLAALVGRLCDGTGATCSLLMLLADVSLSYLTGRGPTRVSQSLLAPLLLGTALELALYAGLYGRACVRDPADPAAAPAAATATGLDALLGVPRKRAHAQTDGTLLRATLRHVLLMRAPAWLGTAAAATALPLLLPAGGPDWAAFGHLTAAAVWTFALCAAGGALWLCYDAAALLLTLRAAACAADAAAAAAPDAVGEQQQQPGTIAHTFVDGARTTREAACAVFLHAALVAVALLGVAGTSLWTLARVLTAVAEAAARLNAPSAPASAAPRSGERGDPAAGAAVFVGTPWVTTLALVAAALTAAASGTLPHLRRAAAVYALRVRLAARLASLGEPPAALVQLSGERFRALDAAEAAALLQAQAAAAAAAAAASHRPGGGPLLLQHVANPLGASAAAAAAAAANGTASLAACASPPLSELSPCAVCMAAPADCVFTACGHTACAGCARRIVQQALYKSAIALQQQEDAADGGGAPPPGARASRRVARSLTARISQWEAAAPPARGVEPPLPLPPAAAAAGGPSPAATLPPPAPTPAPAPPAGAAGFGPSHALRQLQRRASSAHAAAARTPPPPPPPPAAAPAASPSLPSSRLPLHSSPVTFTPAVVAASLRVRAAAAPAAAAPTAPAAANPLFCSRGGRGHARVSSTTPMLLLQSPSAATATATAAAAPLRPGQLRVTAVAWGEDADEEAAVPLSAPPQQLSGGAGAASPRHPVSASLRALGGGGGPDSSAADRVGYHARAPTRLHGVAAAPAGGLLASASTRILAAAVGAPAPAHAAPVACEGLASPADDFEGQQRAAAAGCCPAHPPPSAAAADAASPPAAAHNLPAPAARPPPATALPHWPVCHLCRTPVGHVVRVSAASARVLTLVPGAAAAAAGVPATRLVVVRVLPRG